MKYKFNEVYIAVEHVNNLVSAKKDCLGADVSGLIQVKCFLSAMPACRFGMNHKLVTDGDSQVRRQDRSIALDDYRFH